MTTNVQWTPSVIVKNLTLPGGNRTKAYSEYATLSADRMAMVLGSIRMFADSMTFRDMTNLLIHKASAPGTPKDESETANAFLKFLKAEAKK